MGADLDRPVDEVLVCPSDGVWNAEVKSVLRYCESAGLAFRIAADGTLYQSDTLEFTTPVSSATERTNLAPGGTIADVSSEYSDSYRAANAIDGSLATEWSSRGDGDDAFITVDLGAPVAVTGVGFRSREMADGTSITTSFTVTVDDAETFGPFASGPGLSVADLMVTGQVFRIDVATSTGGNTGAVEIEIYG